MLKNISKLAVFIVLTLFHNTVYAASLTEKDLPAIFAAKDTAAFARLYDKQFISVNGEVIGIYKTHKTSSIRYKAINQYKFACDLSSEQAKEYDLLRVGDSITMKGHIKGIFFDDPMLFISSDDCVITRN